MPAVFHALQIHDFIPAGATERDQARGIGLKGQQDEVEESFHPPREIRPVGNIGRWFLIYGGFGLFDPVFRPYETLFHFSDTGEILIQGFVILTSDSSGDRPGLIGHEVHDALSVLDLPHSGGLLRSSAFQKEALENG